jgi:hypothetical protein
MNKRMKHTPILKDEIKQIFQTMYKKGYNYFQIENHYKQAFYIMPELDFINIYKGDIIKFDCKFNDEKYFTIPDIVFIKTELELEKFLFLEDNNFLLSDYNKLDESDKLKLFEYLSEKNQYMIKQDDKMFFRQQVQNKTSSKYFTISNIIECFDKLIK